MQRRALIESFVRLLLEGADIPAGLVRAARSIRHCGDYGTCYWHPATKHVFWIMADSDGEPEYDSSDSIKRTLKVAGVEEVELGDEGGPPDRDAWVKVDYRTNEAMEEQLPARLYHVTFSNRLEDIANDGLQPNAPRSIGAPSLDGHARGRVFLTSGAGVSFWFDRADMWAHDKSDDFLADGMIPVVLRVPSSALAGELQMDTEGSRDASDPAWFATEGVSPEALEFWDGARWAPVSNWDSIDFSIAIDPDPEMYGEFVSPSPFQPRTLTEAATMSSTGLGRFKITYTALDQREREYTGYGYMLISRNTKVGQKPFRATLFDEAMDLIIHEDLDEDELDVTTWTGDDFMEDGFLLFLQDYLDPNIDGWELEPLSPSRLGETAKKKRAPRMDVLKKHKVKLTDEERKAAMDAGAVWHPGNRDSPVSAIWKSVVNGRTWYGSNTHRTYAAGSTLKGAIRDYHRIVEPSA